MSNEEKYVAAAYLVVFAFVVLYVVIMALKLTRLEREVDALAAPREAPQPEDEREPARVG
jgi:CcmD family protein